VLAADKIMRTLGEGTFGKVVECIDLSRFVSVCLSVALSSDKSTSYICIVFTISLADVF